MNRNFKGHKARLCYSYLIVKHKPHLHGKRGSEKERKNKRRISSLDSTLD